MGESEADFRARAIEQRANELIEQYQAWERARLWKDSNRLKSILKAWGF